MKVLHHPIRLAIGRARRLRVQAQKCQELNVRRKLDAGCLAVQRAARLCREVQSRLKATEEMGKADDSPVTVADFGAQAIVAYTLQEAKSSGESLSLVAEESAAAISGGKHKEMRRRITQLVNQFIPEDAPTLSEQDVLDLIDLGSSEGGSSGNQWVLDPIDGTIGFVSNRQYAVCLGLLSEGKAVMGLLGCPNMPQRRIETMDGQPAESQELRSHGDGVGCLFTGIKGEGAHVGSLWSEQIPKEVIKANELGIQPTPLRLDSQAKYGALSRGDAALFMRFPPSHYREKIWDHCAGTVIVEAAGGCVSDALGNPLDFSQGRFLDIQAGIVAAPPALHSQVTTLMQTHHAV